MALARVVSLEGLGKGGSRRCARVGDGERPQDIPATEILVLHDPDAEKSLVILFFENEEGYRRVHETLDAMPGDETPGRRTSPAKYDVAIRVTG